MNERIALVSRMMTAMERKQAIPIIEQASGTENMIPPSKKSQKINTPEPRNQRREPPPISPSLH